MKKLLLTITALLATATMSAFDSGGLSFTIINSEKNECAVTGYDAATIPTSLDIPAKVADNGITYTVVRIDSKAFQEAPITSLTVPSTVTTIQSRAFYKCQSLTTIDLPLNLESANRAFSSCPDLTTAYIRCKNEPDGWCSGLTSLNQIVYFGSVQMLNNGKMPSTVQYIRCLGNTPPEITYTYKFTNNFYGIVYVPSSAVADYRAADVWKDCRIYSDDATNNGFTFMITDSEKHECQAVHYDKSLGGEVVIPSIVAINGADYTVTGIATKTFYNCDKITSLTIPATVREIGEEFLGYNTRLERITVEDGSRYYKDIDGILYTADGATLLKCPEHYFDPVAVPDGVRTIAEHAFLSSNITSVVLPNTLNEIGYLAFGYCKHLTKVTIPASVTTLGRTVFGGCHYLKYAKIESEVVGEYMFYECTSLKYITLSPKVNKVGNEAFSLHSNYSTTIYVLNTTPPQCEGELSDNANNIAKFTLKVPYESKDAYTNDAIWGKVSTIENTLGSDNNGLTYDSKIYGGSFCGAIYADPQKAVGDFVIPGQVTIGGTTYDVRATFHNIFDDNPKLTSLTMPNSMDMISKAIAPGSINISQYKSNSKYYGFSDGILSYGINSPWITACIPGKEGNVTINRDVVYDYAFYGCDKIASLSFENTVTLGQHAFDGCKGLEKIDVNIGSSFVDAANFVFANCTGLKKATIKSNQISIGTFANCKSLEEVTIEPHNPEYSLLIYKHIFYGCPNLKSITCRTAKPYNFTLDSAEDYGYDILESYRYQDVTLYVPTGSAQAYKEHALWKKFGNIVEKDMGGVDDVFANDDNAVSVSVSAGTIRINGAEADAAVAVYDLAGRTAYSGTSKEIVLGHHGIYIVAVAGKTFKVAL